MEQLEISAQYLFLYFFFQVAFLYSRFLFSSAVLRNLVVDCRVHICERRVADVDE